MWSEKSADELRAMFRNDKYPLSGKYDPQWILDNAMGSQCLWLMESLTQVMHLKPGMRVLDLGCGKAIGSIFLAKEFGVEVWAVDLTIPPTDNWKRIREAGAGNLVFPLRGDARALPFADGFFDAVVSVNSYFIFGTDDFYMPRHFARLLKPGAQAGLILPGLFHEFLGELPEHVKPWWVDHVIAYHSAAWWRRHLEKSGQVKVTLSDNVGESDGVEIWRFWARHQEDALVMKDDRKNITFIRVVAERI